MMEKNKAIAGFSSARSDNFPAGLRVLIVDDDPTWLKILEKMLKKCSYEVTTCCLARDALNLLRERKDGFDIAISDVNMPDMDGFKLLEHVGLEMDLPVIMMSVDGETSTVMKGVQHGACDYLLKPIRMKELRNIWQHVLRKKMHEARDIGNHETEQCEEIWMNSGTELLSGKKRKEFDNKHDERQMVDPRFVDSSSMKKARVVWTVDLHQKFVKAVNQIGFDKVGPKKILDLMGIPWLTRENVASHLQKYRLYLTRLQKEDEAEATFCGMKHSDISSKETSSSLSLQNPVEVFTDVTNDKSGVVSGDKAVTRKGKSNVNTSKAKSVCSVPVAEPKSVVGDNFDSQTVGTKKSLSDSFGFVNADVKQSSKVKTPYEFAGQDFKPCSQSENGLNHQPLPAVPQLPSVPQHIPIECTRPACFLGEERERPSNTDNDHSFLESRSEGIGNLYSVEPTFALEQIPSTRWNTGQSVDQVLVDGLQSSSGNLTLGSGSVVASLREDIQHGASTQGECFPSYNGLWNVEPFSYNDSGIPACLYDPLRFDYEYPIDALEGTMLDQSLFIA